MAEIGETVGREVQGLAARLEHVQRVSGCGQFLMWCAREWAPGEAVAAGWDLAVSWGDSEIQQSII